MKWSAPALTRPILSAAVLLTVLAIVACPGPAPAYPAAPPDPAARGPAPESPAKPPGQKGTPSAPAPSPSPAPVQVGDLFPFVLPWDDAGQGITDLSQWQDRPAGRNGFVVARDGRLYAGERRIRFLGVNLVFGAAFPKHGDAEKMAARLARFGINAVRLHHTDTRRAPDGIWKSDLRSLDLDQLDRFDYLIAELKKHGIYVDINLHVGRAYPGFPSWETMPQYFKGVDNFYPPMVEMQREYARELLTHFNPYTGNRYAEEPAIAFVEINNENGLLREWWSGALDEMPRQYVAELERQWRMWLGARYAGTEALKSAWGTVEVSPGIEMLANADWSQGLKGWTLQQAEGAVGSASSANDGPGGKPALHIKVQQIGKVRWGVQLFQSQLRLEKDRPYTLTFYARADARRAIAVNVMQARAPWRQMWSAPITVTKEWQPFRFVFAAPENDENVRVTFTDLGAATGTYSFSQASLRPGGVLGLQPGEDIAVLGVFRRGDLDSRTPEAQRDWVRFLWDAEERYYTGMYRFIKNDLAVRSLVIGTQVSYSPGPLQAALDVVDAHAYWQHPRFPLRPWDPVNWSVTNVPMAGASDGGTLTTLALRRVAGKPYIVSEYNHPAPNTFSSEAFLLLGAYAAMQDWDGIFAYNYATRGDELDPQRITDFFSIHSHPGKMVTLPAVAAMFLRGDVAGLPLRNVVSFTREMAIERVRRAGPAIGADAFGLGRTEALRSATGIAMTGDAAPAPAAAPPTGPVFVSENGQLRWNAGDGSGVVTVNASRSRAVIGYTRQRTFDLGGVVVAPGPTRQDWSAITLTAIEGDFNGPGRILVTATGYLENTGMGWKDAEKTTVGRDWGKAPVLVEGVPAAITLPVSSGRVKAYALDERGQRGAALPVREVNGRAVLDIGARYRTLWYEVEVR